MHSDFGLINKSRIDRFIFAPRVYKEHFAAIVDLLFAFATYIFTHTHGVGLGCPGGRAQRGRYGVQGLAWVGFRVDWLRLFLLV